MRSWARRVFGHKYTTLFVYLGWHTMRRLSIANVLSFVSFVICERMTLMYDISVMSLSSLFDNPNISSYLPSTILIIHDG
jgi:hypothetical protein